MPSVSQKQHNLMAMVANNPAKAKELGIPKSVGQDFMSADKGKKFGGGGQKSRADSQSVNSPKTNHGDAALFKRGGQMKKTVGMKTGGRTAVKGDHPVQKQAKRGAEIVKMASGGLAAGHKSADGIARKGKTEARQITMKKGGKC